MDFISESDMGHVPSSPSAAAEAAADAVMAAGRTGVLVLSNLGLVDLPQAGLAQNKM